MTSFWTQRNLWLLFIGQLIAVSGSAMSVTLGGIIGSGLATDKALATLPQALHITGVALFAIPAAFYMRRVGRRLGFATAALIGVISQIIAITALVQESFVLFTMATTVLGFSTAFAVQLRFAAVEAVTPDYAARAISFVLVGSIGGAFLGPYLASSGAQWIPEYRYVGGYAVQGVLFLLMSVVYLALVKHQPLTAAAIENTRRPLRAVVTQPLFLVALFAATASYAVMSLIMTATPLSMHIKDGFSLEQTSSVIRAHVIGMYLPSLFSGFLIDKLGVGKILFGGLLILGICLGIAISGRHYMHYWLALIFLGVGWNFLFVGGTTLLTRTYRDSERFSAQAVNEFVVYGSSAAAAFMAGVLIHSFGWRSIVAAAVPILATVSLVLWLARKNPKLR